MTGTVFDSLRTNAPLKGATVALPGLVRYATTDGRGRFRLDSVPAGRVTITFLHPALDSLGVAADIQAVTIPERGSVDVHLTTPSPATAYARLCPGARDVSTGLLFGLVHDVDDGKPIANATVTADWLEYAIVPGIMRGRVARAAAATNEKGVYLLCGIPADVASQVFGLADGYAAGPVLIAPESRLLARFDFSISRRDSAARLSVAELLDSTRRGAPLGTAPGSATISGRIVASNRRPIAGALVGINGTDLSTRSDNAGRFRLGRVPAGTRAMTIRAIGLAPTMLTIAPRSGEIIDTAVTVEQGAQVLPELKVLATRSTRPDRTGFTERARMGFGHFLTEADVERRPGADLYSFLMRMPGLIYNVSGGAPGRAGRRVLMRGSGLGSGSPYCTPNFYLDGTYYLLDSEPEPLLSLALFVQSDNLKGIEVYESSGSIPPKFDRSGTTGCGSVIIWTK
ncbi:MAG: carboxypeptidase regulatory-like domain-containing protein [Gemmatimonadales bacterium]